MLSAQVTVPSVEHSCKVGVALCPAFRDGLVATRRSAPTREGLRVAWRCGKRHGGQGHRDVWGGIKDAH